MPRANEPNFLSNKYDKCDYIKSIIEFKNVSKLDDEFLTRIFDEIRMQQASKKIRSVYGQEISQSQKQRNLKKISIKRILNCFMRMTAICVESENVGR